MSSKSFGGRSRRSAPNGQVVLLPGRDKPVKNHHPWVFSGAVDAIADDATEGSVVEVVGATGEFLAQGFVNEKSQILVRLLSWTRGEPIDAAFFRSRLARAAGARPASPAARIVNAESDGLPGLVVDRYADFVVLQAFSSGMDRRKTEIVAAILDVVKPRGIFERSEGEGREKEGLEKSTGLLAGEAPPEILCVAERTWDGGNVTLGVDVRRGHKTGAYLDQSDNRRVVGSLSSGAEILNLFSYTGAFALHGAAGGATHVLNIDSSADALSLSERMAGENGFQSRIMHQRDDVFDAIRSLRAQKRLFDIVIADPPKFAHSAGQVERATRAYKDLNRLAMELVRPGGYLATFSCSGLVSPDLFQKVVWSASLEAKKDAQMVHRLGHAADHPVLLSFPEGEYLKGLVCRVY